MSDECQILERLSYIQDSAGSIENKDVNCETFISGKYISHFKILFRFLTKMHSSAIISFIQSELYHIYKN